MGVASFSSNSSWSKAEKSTLQHLRMLGHEKGKNRQKVFFILFFHSSMNQIVLCKIIYWKTCFVNFVTLKIFFGIIVSFTGKQARQLTITKFSGFTRTIQFHGESVEIHIPNFVEETDALSCPDCAFTCKTTQEMSSHRNFKHGKYQNRR